MSAYTQILTVNWGESDPFGLVYYAREVAWFNEIEHELFRQIGHPINRMINHDRSAFVMGEIQFRFVGPAAYGDRVDEGCLARERRRDGGLGAFVCGRTS